MKLLPEDDAPFMPSAMPDWAQAPEHIPSAMAAARLAESARTLFILVHLWSCRTLDGRIQATAVPSRRAPTPRRPRAPLHECRHGAGTALAFRTRPALRDAPAPRA